MAGEISNVTWYGQFPPNARVKANGQEWKAPPPPAPPTTEPQDSYVASSSKPAEKKKTGRPKKGQPSKTDYLTDENKRRNSFIAYDKEHTQAETIAHFSESGPKNPDYIQVTTRMISYAREKLGLKKYKPRAPKNS